MNFNLFPEQCKKIGSYIEKKVLKTGDQSAILIGVIFFLISLCAFLFSPSTRELSCATGYELVAYHKISAIFFVATHLLAVLVLLIPNFPDKFQFATTFTIIGIPLLFCIMTNGFKSEGTACTNIPYSVVSFFALMFCWMICGIKANHRKSQLMPFRFIGKLNAWIQEKFDKSQ